MTCWSDLTSDMLEHITSFLSLPDHHRFSAVCKNWRLVAKQKRYSPVEQLPWLVLGDERGTGKRKFYNLSEDKQYAIDIPELRGRYICGSSRGWLLAIDAGLKGILINPFTRELYELPPFPDYTLNFDPPYAVENGPTGNTPSKKMQVRLVFKAILSHDPKERPDFTLMILVGVKNIPAFWKPGDSSWTVVIVHQKTRLDDVMYFNGQFIFVTAANELLAMDFQPHPKLTEIGLPKRRACISIIPQTYLVDYFGVLLLVERWQLADERVHHKAMLFKVIEPNFEEKKFYQRSGVDDKALFLGTNASIAIDASKFPGCNTNSIFFTNVTRALYYEKIGGNDMGIFNIKGKTFDTIFSLPAMHHTRVGAPIWLTPNPW